MSEREFKRRDGERLSQLLPQALDELVELLAAGVSERQRELLAQASASEQRSPWLNIESAARYLDWPPGRLYKLTACGEIPHYKQEGRLLFRRDELDEWLQGFAQRPQGS